MSRSNASARKRGAGEHGEGSDSSSKRGRGRPSNWQSGDLKALEDIGENILAELGRRLEDEEAASKLPATGLMTLAQKYVNYLDVKARILQEQNKKEKETPVLDLVETEGLDNDRKIELLDEYISSLENEIKVAKAKRKELDSGSEKVPELPSVVREEAGGLPRVRRARSRKQQAHADGDPEQPPVLDGGEG